MDPSSLMEFRKQLQIEPLRDVAHSTALLFRVALTAPAVFEFTAPSSADRHRDALAVFHDTTPSDPAISRIPGHEIGAHLYEAIARFLDSLGVPRGLKAVGYAHSDIDALVTGTLPQRRVLDLAPGIGDVAGADGREHLARIIERSMEY